MSRAEEFIKKQSHIIENPTSVWISSYNAREAVEIAREEIYEWLEENAAKSLIHYLKQAMEDE